MSVPRLNFFKLTVPDAEIAATFYTEALGMTRRDVIEAPGFREIMLTCGDAPFTLVLYQWKDGRAIEHGTSYGPLGFLTRDLEATLATLVEKGATPKGAVTEFGSMRIAFVTTPHGHEIELMQRAG